MPELRAEAEKLAKQAIAEFLDDLVEDVVERSGERPPESTRLRYWNDRYYSERLADRPWTVREAIDVVEEFPESVEDDNALWEGQDPSDALRIQAAYTFANAVESEFDGLMVRLNDEIEFQIEDGYLSMKGPPPPELPEAPPEDAPLEAWGRYRDEVARIDAEHERLKARWPEVLRERIRRVVYDVTGVGEPPHPEGVKEWRAPV